MPLPDQSDLIAANERLTQEADAANEKATKATAELAEANTALAKVTAERDQAAADLVTVKASVASLTKQLEDSKAAEKAATEEATKLKGEKVEFEKAVAAKVAEMGISANAAPKDNPAAKPTAGTGPLSTCNAMSHAERNQFIRDGGKISD